jgi:hypothetical protein
MILENDLIRVQLDDRTGGIVSLTDKRTGHDWIGAPDRNLLFRLMVPQGDRECEHVENVDASIQGNGARCVLTFSAQNIDAEAVLELEGDAVLCRLRIRNNGTAPVEEVMFPYVRGLAPVAEAEITWPHFHYRKIRDPFGNGFGGDHHSWNEMAQKLVGRYPFWLTTAWCEYGNADNGISIEGRHTDFSIMDFHLHKVVEKKLSPVRRSLDMATVHPRRVACGESYETSLVRIRLHRGDWHAVADDHRKWLETWVRKPDRPKEFAEAIGWHFYFMKHQDGLEINTYDDLPRMAESALSAGCRYLMVFGWQTGGHDNNYMYRYIPNESWGGAESLKRALDECRRLGVEVIPFYNGTLANTELPEHKEFGYKWEAKTRTGHPYYAGDWARNNFDAVSRNRSMLHHEVCLCEDYYPYFLATMKRIIQDYGFRNTQLDQIAEKLFVCYNPEHGHSSPDRAFVDGLQVLLPRVCEGINDFAGQWCDSAWTWRGLFDYPEPVLYSIPWLFASVEVDAMEYGDVNRAFAYKLHLDMKIDGGDGNVGDYPEFARFIKERAELRRRVAAYYVYGDFRDETHLTLEKSAGVFVKVFHNGPDAKVGIVAAETRGQNATAVIKSAWKGKPSAAVVSSRGSTETLDTASPWSLSLEPFEVRVVCLDIAE